MAEITPSCIESIADPSSGPQDQPAQKQRAKTHVAGKPASPNAPEIGASEEDKHDLDEMA